MSDDRLAFPREELRGRTVRGVALNALFTGATEGLVLAQGLIVSILLGPRAIEERLSVADLRLELRANGYGGRGEKAATGEGSQEQGADVCPHCGHKLSESDD